jgi:hypothetical protein
MNDSFRMSAGQRDVVIAVLIEDLFTNGAGDRAERLVLTSADGRDLGGWSARRFQERLRAHLEQFVRPPTSRRRCRVV